jgi:hypothetical protein
MGETPTRKTHVVPTHLNVPETILSIGEVNLSVRQFLLLALGAATSYNLWLHLHVLTGAPGGQIVRLLLALVPAFVALAFAFLRIAGQTLDRWTLTLLRYWGRPKCLVWRSVRFQDPGVVGEVEDTTDTTPTTSTHEVSHAAL